MAELIHGVEKSERSVNNLKQVEGFISRLEVFDYQSSAAFHYGEIRANLEKKGRNISVDIVVDIVVDIDVNDLRIARYA
ncbi:hypothetical protein TYM08_P2569 [Marinicellulosiphila megalodicopiae]